MDRVAKAIISLLVVATLLSGCSRPEDVNTDLTYSDNNAPGYIPGAEEEDGIIYGTDAWGVDLSKYEGMDEDEAYAQYQADQWLYWEQVNKENAHTETPSYTEKNETPVELAPISAPTWDTVKAYDEDSLLSYYGNRDQVGYYDITCTEAYSDSGQLTTRFDGTYSEAMELYTNLYGERDVEFIYENRRESYWFTSYYVYTVAVTGAVVTESQSPWASDWYYPSDTAISASSIVAGTYDSIEPASALCREYGNPYHTDFFNLIWKTDTAWYAVNRRTFAVSVKEV